MEMELEKRYRYEVEKYHKMADALKGPPHINTGGSSAYNYNWSTGGSSANTSYTITQWNEWVQTSKGTLVNPRTRQEVKPGHFPCTASEGTREGHLDWLKRRVEDVCAVGRWTP